MIIDKKGKLFGKINIIDLCVVLFVLAAVLISYFKFNISPSSVSGKTNVDIVYTVKISDVRKYTADQLKNGDSLYDDESGKYIGKITGVKRDNAMEYVLKTDGTYEYSEKPERYDVYVTLETKGTADNNGYYAEGVRQILPHSTIILSNNKVRTSSSVVEVEVK